MTDRICLDHADIVVTHACNMKCPFCIDPLRGAGETVGMHSVEAFLELLRSNTDKRMTILLLGGEPTMVGAETLNAIAERAHAHGFKASISTNGAKMDVIEDICPSFDWVQVTTHSERETDKWREVNSRHGNINLKLAGDQCMTLESLEKFIETTEEFGRRSVSMYFTPDFKDVCTDRGVWSLLDSLDWTRNGSYMYAMHDGVRFKKCIPGETNIIDEPTVPKLYPNGCYNKTWTNEAPDMYLGPMEVLRR